MTDNQCKIWPESTASKVSEDDEHMGRFYVLDSRRAAGDYWIEELAARWCEHNNDEKSRRIKARLTTWLIDNPGKGVKAPSVTRKLISQMESTPDLPIPVRCERLLRKLASYSNPIINITQSAGNVLELLAWSESVEISELTHLISMLQSSGYVHFDGRSISVTEAGILHFQELDQSTRPGIGFKLQPYSPDES